MALVGYILLIVAALLLPCDCAVARMTRKYSLQMEKEEGISSLQHLVSNALDGLTSLSPHNALSCYVTQPDTTTKTQSCPSQATECGVVTADVTPPGGAPVHATGYSCATSYACSHQDEVCALIQKQLPPGYVLTNCQVKCCTSDNCNKPSLQQTTNQGSYINQIVSNGLTKVLPRNAHSCYVTQPDSTVVTQSCPSQATECGVVTADVTPPGGAPVHATGYSCATSYACTHQDEVCALIQKRLPPGYVLTNCQVKCCTSDNCNKPSLQQTTNQGSYVNQIISSGLTKVFPHNAHSCYVTQPDATVKTQSCPSQTTECGVVTVNVTPPGGAPVSQAVYICASAYICDNPSIFCDNFRKSLPSGWKLNTCQLKCCASDNCNKPTDRQLTNEGKNLISASNIIPSITNPLKSDHSVNSRSCYVSQTDTSVVSSMCPNYYDKCVTMSLEIRTSNASKISRTEYRCTNSYLCAFPSYECFIIRRNLPEGSTLDKCDYNCCTNDNCNKPTIRRLINQALIPSLLPTLSDVIMIEPANALSCYTTQPDLRVVSKSCSVSLNRCLTISLELIPPGGTKLSEMGYACTNDYACSNPSIICNAVQKNLPEGWKVSSCQTKCCSSNNCNKPSLDHDLLQGRHPVVGLSHHLRAPASLADRVIQQIVPGQTRSTTVNNNLAPPPTNFACYVTQHDGTVVENGCPGPSYECSMVTFKIVPPGGTERMELVYGCASTPECNNPKETCLEIIKHAPPGYVISDCTMICCTGDDCNIPNGQKKITF